MQAGPGTVVLKITFPSHTSVKLQIIRAMKFCKHFVMVLKNYHFPN